MMPPMTSAGVPEHKENARDSIRVDIKLRYLVDLENRVILVCISSGTKFKSARIFSSVSFLLKSKEEVLGIGIVWGDNV